MFSDFGVYRGLKKGTQYNNKDESNCKSQDIPSEDSASVGQQIKTKHIRIQEAVSSRSHR